jgi:hypothetical protein
VLGLGGLSLGLFRPADSPAGEKAAAGAPPREGSTARPEGRAWRPAVLEVDTPLSPPPWALLERELLRANTSACQEFFARYFDERGFLLCVERWGGDDGPDDAIECCAEWTLLHALGAPEVVLRLYRKAWEGHLRQYTQARTREVPFARDGMYYKEFPVMFDWLHHAEGLTAFNFEGLADPGDARLLQRARRFAGFYMNEDPGAPNYDPRLRIIRSLFNGSRGPLLRKATALDWAGDPIELNGRFRLLHGERSYEEMLAHFKDYTDIVGDHPQNLAATSLGLNAWLLTHEEKYRRWLLEYTDAWRERMAANGGIIPTNIGPDGKIGGSAGGKWYGGVYGWGFSVTVPQTGQIAHRNSHYMGLVGFTNAYLLTGDRGYLDGWARQIDLVNAQAKREAGRLVYPQMHGERGWYHFTPQPYSHGALLIYHLLQREADRKRVPPTPWLDWLEGKAPDYPEKALRADLERVRRRVLAMRRDESTPDTRLSDNPLEVTPASVDSLLQLTLGGLPPGRRGLALHARVRYFDLDRRRAGLPEDVAALVEKLTDKETTLTLVNVNQLESRRLVLQGGVYGEHQILALECGGRKLEVGAPWVPIVLGPGCGARISLAVKRHANVPTLAQPPWLGEPGRAGGR